MEMIVESVAIGLSNATECHTLRLPEAGIQTGYKSRFEKPRNTSENCSGP